MKQILIIVFKIWIYLDRNHFSEGNFIFQWRTSFLGRRLLHEGICVNKRFPKKLMEWRRERTRPHPPTREKAATCNNFWMNIWLYFALFFFWILKWLYCSYHKLYWLILVQHCLEISPNFCTFSGVKTFYLLNFFYRRNFMRNFLFFW